MRINYKDFGPLKTGFLELSNLTVICGSNNCGKTYIAHSIDYIQNEYLPSMYDKISKLLSDKIKKLLLVSPSIEFKVQDYYDELHHNNLITNLNAKIKKEIASYFSVSDDFFKDSSLKIQISYEEVLAAFKKSRIVISIDNELYLKKDSGSYMYSFKQIIDEKNITDENKTYQLHLVEAIARDVVKDSFNEMGVTAFTIPGERSGLALLYKSYISEAMDVAFDITSVPPTKIKANMNTNVKITRPVLNYIKFLNGPYNGPRFHNKPRESFDFSMSSSLLSGNLIIESNNIQYKPSDTDMALDLYMASSSVKSLLGLDLFLRYGVDFGYQTLIIDEPELNLHPKLQREIAKVLAHISNSGVKVIITTHSEFIMNELNILLNINSLSPNLQEKYFKEYGYNQKMLLSTEGYRAYTVKDCSLELMSFDKQEGYIINSFNDTILNLNTIINELIIDLEDGEINAEFDESK